MISDRQISARGLLSSLATAYTDLFNDLVYHGVERVRAEVCCEVFESALALASGGCETQWIPSSNAVSAANGCEIGRAHV